MTALRQDRRPVAAGGDVRSWTGGSAWHKGDGLATGTVFRSYRPMPPRLVAYEYRTRVYPWAVRALEAAEAVHGKPRQAGVRGRAKGQRDAQPRRKPGGVAVAAVAVEPAPDPVRCGTCGYVMSSVSHRVECLEAA